MKLNELVGFWVEDGFTKDRAMKALFEQDWYESRMLSEADVDAMAGFYDR